MKYDTRLKIGGSDFVTNKETAVKLYELLADNVAMFSEYSNEMLSPLTDYNLQMSPLDPEFNEDIKAAQTLGVTFGEYYRNKSN